MHYEWRTSCSVIKPATTDNMEDSLVKTHAPTIKHCTCITFQAKDNIESS